MEEIVGRRLLVVEDMVAMRDHIAECLLEVGEDTQVDVADNGAEALERIRQQSYDLIVTDLTMPRMDGETLIGHLRAEGFEGAVVVLTAHGEDDTVVRCLRAGACDYLVKPVTVEDLQMAVTTALQHMPRIGADLSVDYDPHGWFEVIGGTDYSVLYRYRRFLGLLDAFQLPEQQLSEIKLALEELGRNAMEWGNRFDPVKKVRFSCRILPYKIIIQIADEGEGFKPDEVPDPSEDPFGHIQRRQAAGKRLGGYGVHLIRNLMDKVTWNRRGNVVVAIKYLDQVANN